jgi:ribosomal protein S18 acetylase RimI-like enzyme
MEEVLSAASYEFDLHGRCKRLLTTKATHIRLFSATYDKKWRPVMVTIFKELKTEDDLIECTHVIRVSFKTVAEEFGLTAENAPSHPSNMTYEKLRGSIDRGLKLFGLVCRNEIIGCVGIERSGDEGCYYIERVSVLPEFRHKGLGTMLLDFACGFIRDQKGKKASLTMINNHNILKEWYRKYGFI